MKAFKIIAIILVIAALSFLAYKGIVDYKRKKVVDAIVQYAKDQGKTIDEVNLRNEFYKLNNTDMNNLITFFQAVQKKQYVAALGQMGAVLPTLTKLNLVNVFANLGG